MSSSTLLPACNASIPENRAQPERCGTHNSFSRMVDINAQKKDPEQVLSWVDSIALSSICSFYNLRLKKAHRLCAVVVAHMLQHGTGGLRATAAEVVIELANTLNVQTVLALENWPADLASADHVHNSEHTTVFPIRCDCNHSCITFVLEKEEAASEEHATTHPRAHCQPAKREGFANRSGINVNEEECTNAL
jgi:hypothetical protein